MAVLVASATALGIVAGAAPTTTPPASPAAAAAAAAGDELDDYGSVSGRVTAADTGAPVGGIDVTVMGPIDSFAATSTVTSADGTYILQVPPGQLTLEFRAAAAPPRPYATEYYDNAWTFADATWVTVAPMQAVTDLDVTLERPAVLTGTVSAEAGGTPIDSTWVRAFDMAGDDAAIGLTTDGVYRLEVTPGRYTLQAQTFATDAHGYGYGSEFHLDAATRETATAVVAAIGATTVVDFSLATQGRITGIVTDSATGDPIAGLFVAAHRTDGSSVTRAASDFTGRYVLPVDTGAYALLFDARWNPSTQHYSAEWFDNARSIDAATIVSVTSATTHIADAALRRLPTATATGVFRPSDGHVYLKDTNASGYADTDIFFGTTGDVPVSGDWNGDDVDTIGIYRNGTFYLRNANTPGYADMVVGFGTAGDLPVAGDWDGDGVDTMGIYRDGTFYLRDSNSPGGPDLTFILGGVGDVPIAGDWDGDGTDTVGVFRPSNGYVYLKAANTSGYAEIEFFYGAAGDQAVTGDWDDDGIDTIGIYRDATFHLRNSNTPGYAELTFSLGIPGDIPITGRWGPPS